MLFRAPTEIRGREPPRCARWRTSANGTCEAATRNSCARSGRSYFFGEAATAVGLGTDDAHGGWHRNRFFLLLFYSSPYSNDRRPH